METAADTDIRVYRSNLATIADHRIGTRTAFATVKTLNLTYIRLNVENPTDEDTAILRAAIGDVLRELRLDDAVLAISENTATIDMVWFRWPDLLDPQRIRNGMMATAIFLRQFRLALCIDIADEDGQKEQIDFVLDALSMLAEDQAMIEMVLDTLAASPLGEFSPPEDEEEPAPERTTRTTNRTRPAPTPTATRTDTGDGVISDMPVTPLEPTLETES